ncbi:MAG: energy transducer TonB [Ignavibacteriaceae bacterium]|jgi:protein TonB|nr:MAG: TonB protein [Chlorobi bacterium OLB4]MBW7856325.1 energy transducer TonB [Ignavibacteria bacterium]MEB2329417.1 energy transducer TonB [Ignavibacteriaceae bacterium]OQY78923.1 MAG: hypothetical protein B6D43_00955 [Ignavibacteriales bacterium UTCHB1]
MSDQNTKIQSDQVQDQSTSDSLINSEGYFYKMAYGAPELKKLYQKYATRGIILAILLHVLIIGSYVFALILESKANERDQNLTNIIQLEDLDTPPSANDEEVPPPPEVEVPQEIIPLKDLEALIPEPVARQEAEILTTKTQEALEEILAPVSSEGSENAPNVGFIGKIDLKKEKMEQKLEKKEEKNFDQNKIFQQFEVEKAPSPVNLGAVRNSMRYPEIARSSGIEGRVTVRVLVGTSGSIERIGSISGPDVFHSEVSSKVMSLQFTPGLQNGKPVRVWVSVPFNFTLGSKFKKEKEEEKTEEKTQEETTKTPTEDNSGSNEE